MCIYNHYAYTYLCIYIFTSTIEYDKLVMKFSSQECKIYHKRFTGLSLVLG